MAKFYCYDVTELLQLLEQEQHGVAVRCRIFAWMLGLACIAIGLFAWASMAREWTLGVQVGGIVIAMIACAGCLAVFQKISKYSGHWPRCPKCDAKLYSFQPALRRCPQCRARIATDFRPYKPGYSLPDPEALLPRPPGQKSCSVGIFAGQLLMIAFIATVILLLKASLGNLQDPDIPEITARMLVGFGVLVLLFSGIVTYLFEQLLKLVVLIDLKCDKLNLKMDKNYRSSVPDPMRLCPHCREIPNHRMTAITGNCSSCGGHILEIEEEPDTPGMMDCRLLLRYEKLSGWGVWYLILMIPGLLAFRVLEKVYKSHWLVWTALALFFAGIPLLWNFVLLRSLRKKWRLHFKCPHCGFKLGSSNNPAAWRILCNAGHCLKCRRKLVRSGDEP